MIQNHGTILQDVISNWALAAGAVLQEQGQLYTPKLGKVPYNSDFLYIYLGTVQNYWLTTQFTLMQVLCSFCLVNNLIMI